MVKPAVSDILNLSAEPLKLPLHRSSIDLFCANLRSHLTLLLAKNAALAGLKDTVIDKGVYAVVWGPRYGMR